MINFKRFPVWRDVASVYAVIVIFIYGWSAYWFIWTVPSWIHHLTLAEIFLILAYALTVNLLESLLLLALTLGLFFILAQKGLKDESFVLFGVTLNGLIAVGLYYFQDYAKTQEVFSRELLTNTLGGFLLAILVSFLLGKFAVSVKLVSAFTDRAQIFLYLTLPTSVISSLVVLLRLFIL